MAKKKEKPAPWTAKFTEMAKNITELNRAKRQAEARHVPKIPSCTIFMNGKRVVLNAD